MNYRNVPLLAGWLLVLANVAAAQATPATPPAKRPALQSAAPTAPSRTRSTASAKVNISADSAKTIVAAQAPGMTIKSERLRGKGNHRMYHFQLTENGKKGVRYATVDANSGAFTLKPMASTSTKARTKAEHRPDSTKTAKPGGAGQ
jgi:peptidase YpeB-like protein